VTSRPANRPADVEHYSIGGVGIPEINGIDDPSIAGSRMMMTVIRNLRRLMPILPSVLVEIPVIAR